MVALALRVSIVVLSGGGDPPEAGAAVEWPLGGVAVLLGSERVDDEVLGGVAEGEASAVGLRWCPASGARAVAEGRPHEVGGAALELDAGVRPAGAEADDVRHVSVIDVRVAAFGLRLTYLRACCYLTLPCLRGRWA